LTVEAIEGIFQSRKRTSHKVCDAVDFSVVLIDFFRDEQQ